MAKWKKQPPLNPKEISRGCLNCSTVSLKAPMDMVIAVGFGWASVTRDGEPIYQDDLCEREEDYWTVADAEKQAAKDPDRDWRIETQGPLHGEVFQRHGLGEWVCIRSNLGFA